MRRKILQLALLTVSSTACLGGGECVLRGYLDWQYEQAVANYPDYRARVYKICDTDYYYAYKVTGAVPRIRKVVGRDEAEGQVTLVWHDNINENHLRGEVVDISKLPADTRRILFIGDSYTYGECMEFEAVFHQCIERSLRAEGTQVKCINAGVPGYNSAQEFALLEEIFDQYKPDMVVLGYVMNDAQALVKVPRPRGYTYSEVDSILFEESKSVLNWLGRALVRDEDLFRKKKLDGGDNNYRRSFQKDSIGWRTSKRALARMARLCGDKGADFRVVVLPDFTEPFDSRYRYTAIHDAICEWGRQDEYLVQDLLPRFHNQDSANLRVKYDGHPNELAHQRIAEMMLPGIRGALRLRDVASLRDTGRDTGSDTQEVR